MEINILDAFGSFTVAFLTIYAAAMPLNGSLAGELFAAVLIVLGRADIPSLSPLVFRLSMTLSALLVVKKEFVFSEFTRLVLNFIIISLAAFGAGFLREELNAPEEWRYVFEGAVPAVTALTYDAGRRISRERLHLTVAFPTENGERFFKGFLDTGNGLYSGGEPVVVISEKVAGKLGIEPAGEIYVRTVAGIKALPLGRAEYKIYYDKNKHKLYSTPVAISDKMGFGQEVLLHRDMIEALRKEDKCLKYSKNSKTL